MIETLVNSKTRIKVLKLFLSHIDDRYYLREIERLLGESLSPLRRQLIKLTNMGILVTEEESNLKYYRVNKNFEGLEELKKVVLGQEVLDLAATQLHSNNILQASEAKQSQYSSSEVEKNIGSKTEKQFRYDLAILSFISVFVLATAIFLVYTNAKNIKQVVNMVSNKTAIEQTVLQPGFKNTSSNGEMMSKKWKVMSGNIPVLSSGEIGEDKNSKEL